LVNECIFLTIYNITEIQAGKEQLAYYYNCL
jgi:hypothetical protein